jgi:hypothetical protein
MKNNHDDVNHNVMCIYNEYVVVTIIQHPFTRGGPHTLWDPPLVKGCCMIVVHLVYNNHYSHI